MSKRKTRPKPGPKGASPPQVTAKGPDAYAQQRLDRTRARYQQALRTGTVKTRADGDARAQLEHYMKTRYYLHSVEQKAREVLDEAGISTALYPLYMGFGLRADKICRVHEGETRRLLVQDCLERWVVQGLRRNVLEAVRDYVTGAGSQAEG